ncbi:TnsA endonuclease N-terminal domain-containing protein [Pseudomonas aeruginosa]|uniref:TnsA endonuclease N-terminal domain-containing protein n=1 Tax=Pseudomonas aeruginosa TaxID=287 RepID=UPI0018E29532|nr:TnsA endonuclease N-terminal domain-containing protein [Pseudomonas aeruginosa]MBX5700387.1 TnsA endonuclease N-terminal domain-containing protein [Pseudomonas aeruginosa]MDA3168824.1 TnsA endonuclease N-terminal domain-containing protein [Pseudomonas aeruginosa]MDU0680271.1 TnsA endonuclease N-terminal domain-containing protein [Pseudomonas aeruginosa]QQD35976.1 TnsA endonuclease N-terminal domain-containing protein [Pseudomonas aeruginosa]UJB87472.1 TnsA endonuclease N-terminal domain-con
MSSISVNGRSISQTRKIKSTRLSLSGVYSFRGIGVPFESTLERDFVQSWDISPVVKAIVAQPVQIPFTASNGRDYVCVPDYLVQFEAHAGIKPMLVEVKPREDWLKSWRGWLPKWRTIWRYAREHDWSFHIYDESRIRGVRLMNAQFLQRFRHLEFEQAPCDAVIHTVELMGQAPFQYLVARHFTGDEDVGRSLVWHLMATRKIAFDLNDPIDEFTILRSCYEH